MSIRARKTPEIVSRTWVCTRSDENSTEYVRLLFCTEKIVLSNKLSNRHRVERTIDIQLRGRWLTVVKLILKFFQLREEVVDGNELGK